MSYLEDVSFLRLVSHRLQLLKSSGNDQFQFRCIYCGDSQRNKFKTRGTLFKSSDGNSLVYGCFNQCGAPASFYKFLETLDISVARDYRMRNFKSKGQPDKFESLVDPCEEIVEDIPDLLGLNNVFPVSISSKAVAYLKSRSITNMRDIYFTNDAHTIVNRYRPDTKKIDGFKNKEAIVFPLMTVERAVYGFQMRFLEGDFRYMTIMIDRRFPKILGLQKVDFKRKIFITEGVFDAMMFDNALANLDATLHNIASKTKLHKKQFVLVYDNEPHNKEVMQMMKKGVDEGYDVYFWPEGSSRYGKDFNDIRKTNKEYFDFLMANIKSDIHNGLNAKLKFQALRK